MHHAGHPVLKSKSFEKRFCDPDQSLLVLCQKAIRSFEKRYIGVKKKCKALRKARPGPLKNGKILSHQVWLLIEVSSYGKACSRTWTCSCAKKCLGN